MRVFGPDRLHPLSGSKIMGKTSAETCSKIAVDIDGSSVRVPVGRKRSHAVIGDPYKCIKGFIEEINHKRIDYGGCFRHFEISEKKDQGSSQWHIDFQNIREEKQVIQILKLKNDIYGC